MSLAHSASCASSRSSALLLVGVLAVLFSQAGLGQTKGHGVEVRAMSPKLLDTEPGRIVSLSFQITNYTNGEAALQESLELPAEWQAIIPISEFALEPSEKQVRLVAFSVPRSTPAGEYQVSYSVRSRADYDVWDTEVATVVVLRVTELSLLIEEKPDAAIAGEEYRARLRLINHGNASIEVELGVTSSQKYPARLDPAAALLPAGGSQPITLTVMPDRKESRTRRHVVQVAARDATTNEPLTLLAVSVDIIPRVTGKPDLRHRVPANLTIQATGEGRDAGMQVELAGSGTLDEAGTKEIDFLLRGPDTEEHGVFGRRDEYWLNYAAANLDVCLGDQSYGLSSLTDYHRYGRGAAVSVEGSRGVRFGALGLKSRWESPRTQQVGAYLGKRFDDGLGLQLNLLRRDQSATEEEPSRQDQVWSLEGTLNPSDATDLTLEYGRSKSDQQGVDDDAAYRVEMEGRAGQWTHYLLSKIRAGADYRGYYRDCDHTSAAVTWPLADGVRGRIAYQRWRQNLALRPAQETAPEETLARVGISREFASRWHLALEADSFRRCDLLVPAEDDSTERALGLSLGRSSDTYNVRLDVRRGTLRDLPAQRATTVTRWSGYVSYRPSRRQSLTFYGGAGGDELDGSRLLGFANNLGASFIWSPSDNSRFRFSYVRYGFNVDNRRSSGQLNLEASRTLPDESTWTLRVRRNGQGLSERDDITYSLSYTIPLGIAVSRKKSIGAISGKVYYSENGVETPIADAVVMVDGTGVVTGRDGRFAFPALTPGEHFVRVDRASIGLTRVTKDKYPRAVAVNGGETTRLDIEAIRAACVTGRLNVVAPDDHAQGSGSTVSDGPGDYLVGNTTDGGEPSPTGGVGGVLMVLGNGDEVLRTVTDDKGEFLFEILRPGPWRLSVHARNLPPFHYLEKTEMDLELKAGEKRDISLRVLPRLRRIRMLDDSEEELVPQRMSSRTPDGPDVRSLPPGS